MGENALGGGGMSPADMAAAGDVNNVAKTTAVQTCCCGPETVTIVNTGATTVIVENPSLFIKRVA